jgi:beta-glucosidase
MIESRLRDAGINIHVLFPMKILFPMKKHITSIALAFALLLPAVAQAQKGEATKPEPQINMRTGEVGVSWWERHAELVKRAQAGGFDIMFIGDSITHQWERQGNKDVWAAKLAPLGAKAFGIGGDRTENLLWRLQWGLLDGKSDAKLFVMMIGTNNTGHRMDKPADIAAGVKACINEIQKRKPDAKILVLAIFPRGADAGNKSRLNNEAANKLIQKFADGKKVYYADIGNVFLTKEGMLEKSVMPDLLHLTADSYNLWADAVIPEIQKIMPEKK